MEISKKAWRDYITKLQKINIKAANLMEDWIANNGYDDIEAMIYWANGLTQKYGNAAAALACEMYDSIAAASGVVVPPAIPAEVMPEEYVAMSVRKTLDKAPTTIPRVIERIVKQAGADTTLQNAQRDGAQFAWIPNGDTCAFCITLASRGWQYMSKKALKNGHAEHIHSNCDCEYAIRFSEKDSVAGYDPQKYADMYYGADGNTPQEKINSMRRAQYADDKEKINKQKRIAYDVRKNLTKTADGVMMASDKYYMPEAKITEFLLKPGAKHSKEFFDVGYTISDAKLLNEDIEKQFDMKNAYDERELSDGAYRFSIDMMLGVSKRRTFRTVWQKDAGLDKARFITAHREGD